VLIVFGSSAVYPDIVTTKGGDVVVLVMPGVSLVYVARVIQDGEGLDTIKDRFITSIRPKAFVEASAMARTTGGRVLQWMIGATEPKPWTDA
jgi:hypothetical protein